MTEPSTTSAEPPQSDEDDDDDTSELTQSPLGGSRFPSELTTCDQWVGWRTQQRDGTETKVPLNPADGRFAAVNNSDSWGTLNDALARAEYDSVDGVGFVFTETDPFVGVDLDDCRDPVTGELDDQATAIVDALDSYTEVSPSGTGVHVLVRGHLPEGRSRRGHVELYEHSRFFTMTGTHVDGSPESVNARVDELAEVHAEFVADDQFSDTGSESTESESESESSDEDDATESRAVDSIEDQELIDRAKAAENGDKFSRLWRGETSGYASHSEADMALCALLAFWTDCDEARMDRLFRESGLYRGKWDDRHFADGSTYGEKTLQRAIDGTTETYTPTTTEDSEKQARPEPVTPSEAVSSDTPDREQLSSLRALERVIEARTERIETLERQLEDARAKQQEVQAELEQESARRERDRTLVYSRLRGLITDYLSSRRESRRLRRE